MHIFVQYMISTQTVTCTYIEKFLMDFDFDPFLYCWGEFLKCSAGVYTFLFISKIHPNTEIRDRNLSASKFVTFLYLGTCLWYYYVCIFFNDGALGEKKVRRQFSIPLPYYPIPLPYYPIVFLIPATYFRIIRRVLVLF